MWKLEELRAMAEFYFYSPDDNLTDDTDNMTDDIPEMCRPDRGQEDTNKAVQLVIFVIFLVVFVLGVIGNVLVIATFARYRRLRMRCMTDVFLFYLALSDLLLLLTLPLQNTEQWTYGDGLCKLNHGMYAINTYGGLLLLACISIDRYLLVVRATAAQALRPSMLLYSKLSALAVAVTSVILSLPDLLYASVVDQRCDIFGEDGGHWVRAWPRITKIGGFGVPFVSMLVCYSIIGHVLMQGRGKCWRRQRTLRLIVALVLLFLLFQLPYTIVLLIRLFMSKTECRLWIRMYLAEDITRSLAYVRCCLNPLLYALVGVRFRNDVVRLLYDAGCKFLAHLATRPDSRSSVTPSSPPPTYLHDAYVSTKISEDASSKSNQPQKFIF